SVALRESTRPTAVRLNYFINLLHQPDGFGQCNYDLLVVRHVGLRQCTVLAVLEPLLADLVAANVQIPNGLRHAIKSSCAWNSRLIFLRRRSVKPNSIIRPADPHNLGVLWVCRVLSVDTELLGSVLEG